MTQPPYIIVEADEQRPLMVIHLRVYADRIACAQLGRHFLGWERDATIAAGCQDSGLSRSPARLRCLADLVPWDAGSHSA